MSKKGYTEIDAANDTNVNKKEVSSAWHQARNDAQRSGEILAKRNLSEKDDVPFKNEGELKTIAENDQMPSQEQLEKWKNNQIEAEDYNSSIKIAEQIMNEEGEGFFNDNSEGIEQPETASKIQAQVNAEQDSSGQTVADSQSPSESQNEGQKR